MNEKYYCFIKDGFIDGTFYVESIHGVKICEVIMANGGICIDKELHQYCTSLTGKRAVNEERLIEHMETSTMHMNDGNFTYIPSYDEFVFGIEVKDCFTSVIEPDIPTPEPPSELELLTERIEILENKNAALLLDSVNKDIRLEQNENDIADLLLVVGGM